MTRVKVFLGGMSRAAAKNCCGLLLLIAFSACAPQRPGETKPGPASGSSLAYPSAPRGNVVDDFYGTKVADPYRWLENLDSPETRAWVLAEAKLTDSYLNRLPARSAIKQRLTQLLDFEKFGIPFRAGEKYFYTHNSGLQEHSVLYSTPSLAASPTIAFDPNHLAGGGRLAITGYVVSYDGNHLAYGVSAGGSDWTDWHIRDLTAGQDLPDVIRWTKYYKPAFALDGRGLYYSAFPSPAPGEELRARDVGNAVYYHLIGTKQSNDLKLYERPDHPDWQFEAHLTPDNRWLVLTAGEGEVGDKGLENIYAIDLKPAGTGRPEPFRAITLSEGFNAAYIFAGADSNLFYFQTTLDAPRGRVIAINPHSPEMSQWKEIIPQGPDTLDIAYGSVTLVDNQLIVRVLHDATSKVSTYGLNGIRRSQIELPGLGVATGFAGKPEDHETFYQFNSLTTPATIYHRDLETGASTIFRAPKISFNPESLESKQVFYQGKDGTRIPMFLVYKKGMVQDGKNPTILYGYGGFGISRLPTFDPARMVWLEHGGIFAIANIRGGGEYGEEWHRQGTRSHKQVVFDDFIAAAEWLIRERFTSTPNLAIEGGSNGGLLVGACLTQRPDLFGAALAYVGVMDMLRFDRFGQGAGWIGDYGSPHEPKDFKALYAYSPYHNVKMGTRYPATLIITGDHDTRVMPAHSFKFAAALQAAQAGKAPILLRVNLSAGHGGGPTTSQSIDEKADAYAFLMQNLARGIGFAPSK
jgi:prolyl oligopeptidase